MTAEFVAYLAHRSTPEDPDPGLNLTYSEVVGAVYEMQRQRGIAASFATETDRLRASLYEAVGGVRLAARPESSENAGDEPAWVFEPNRPRNIGSDPTQPEGDEGGFLVPIASDVLSPGRNRAVSTLFISGNSTTIRRARTVVRRELRGASDLAPPTSPAARCRTAPSFPARNGSERAGWGLT